jgi:hypothetical protein
VGSNSAAEQVTNVEAPTVSLSIARDDDDAVLATWRGHVFALWRVSSAAAAEDLARVVLSCARARPGRVAYLAVIPPSVPLPDAAARAIYAKLGRDVGSNLACIGVVVEGRGFVASAMRMAVTSIGLAARASFPLVCFADLDEAARWASEKVARKGGELGSVSDVGAAFAAMRARRA